MTRTSNYDLIVVEGSDKVNLLTQMNPNTEKIDEVMKTNEKSGVQVATELLTGTVHAITRTVKSASMFKFTAISNYTSGDTFTVDGVQVTALLTSGEALGTGAYIIGSEVLCSLKDTLLTVYTQGGTVKIAEDAEKLGGNLPEYYAQKSELNSVKITADSASSLSRTNSESINMIKQSLVWNMIGSKTGDINSASFDIPDNYREVCVFIDVPTSDGYYTFSNMFINSQYKQTFIRSLVLSGFYNGYKNSAFAQSINSKMFGFSAVFNETDYTHNSGASVYVFGR